MKKLLPILFPLLALTGRPYTITLGSSGSQTNKTAGSSWAVAYSPFPFNISAGQLVVVSLALDNIGTTTDGDKGDVTAVSDGVGNVYAKAVEFTNVQNGAGAGATISIWYCVLSNAVTASTTLTWSLNGSVTAKADQVIAFSIATGNKVAVEATATRADDNADPGSLSFSSLPNREYLFLRCSAIEATGGSSITATTNFSPMTSTTPGTTGSGSASNMSIAAEVRIVTATSQSSDFTVTSADCASAMVAFYEFTPPPHKVYLIQ